jgi:hypothetical protein
MIAPTTRSPATRPATPDADRTPPPHRWRPRPRDAVRFDHTRPRRRRQAPAPDRPIRAAPSAVTSAASRPAARRPLSWPNGSMIRPGRHACCSSTRQATVAPGRSVAIACSPLQPALGRRVGASRLGRRRRLPLDHQVADNVDSSAGGCMLDPDARSANLMDRADRRAVLPGDRPPRVLRYLHTPHRATDGVAVARGRASGWSRSGPTWSSGMAKETVTIGRDRASPGTTATACASRLLPGRWRSDLLQPDAPEATRLRAGPDGATPPPSTSRKSGVTGNGSLCWPRLAPAGRAAGAHQAQRRRGRHRHGVDGSVPVPGHQLVDEEVSALHN